MENFNLSKCDIRLSIEQTRSQFGCDKCERLFDESKEELTYCDKCDHCLCASCYPNHHDNLTNSVLSINKKEEVWHVEVIINTFDRMERLLLL